MSIPIQPSTYTLYSVLKRMNAVCRGLMISLIGLALAGTGAFATDLFADYQVLPVQSAYGPVSRVEFSAGVVKLEPHGLVQSSVGTMRDFHFSQPVWVIGYKSKIYDADGESPRQNYLCHTFFGDQRVVQRQDQRMRALYS